MKKFIITILASFFGLLFLAPAVFAGGFNDGPQDLSTVMVSNYTQNPCAGGPGVGCWTSSVSANPGDIVSVRVYYHNTTNQTAYNTSIGLGPKNSAASTNQTFRGGVAVGGMVVAEGSASVQLSSAQTLTFIPGSIRWYPNQTTSAGQTVSNENALFTNGSGLSIGDIGPGWETQGSVVASFKVGGNINPTPQCQINNFTASNYSITRGNSSTLSWNTSGCDYVNITSSDQNFNNRSTNSSVSVSPSYTTTYTLTAYPGGASRNLTINVSEANRYCSVDSFYASPSTINRGDNTTLRWNTSGDVNYVTISGLSGNRGNNGSISVSPYSTTTYGLRVYCNDGSSRSSSATVYVNNSNNAAPQAITTVPIVLGGTQVRLNGIAVPNSNVATSAWFEWGTTGVFGYRTNSQVVSTGSSQSYSDLISNLTPGRFYFYRAVVQNQNGIAYGETVRFQTTKVASTPTPHVIVKSTTTTVRNVVSAQSAPSLLELRVESSYDRMCINGQMDYTITYRNISNQVLEKAVLQFNHPKEITYLSSSQGKYEVTDRTMTIDLGSVQPGEEGTITIRARVNETAIAGNLTVATATVVYTNTKTHAQEDAIAYSLVTVSNDCPTLMGVSIFGSFLPTTLIGWLLLILVILALIVLIRYLSNKKEAHN